jgi:parallel beta-helix repeat protein
MISSNEEFALAGFPGDGSSTNPYIIEGFNITSDETSIRIADTDAYFVTRDCLLAGGFDGDGVVLHNVTNGEIRNNVVHQRLSCIVLNGSSEITVVNNEATNNTSLYHLTTGIRSEESSGNVLTDNVISDNSYGIRIISSSNTTMSGNVIEDNNRIGVWIEYSSSMTLSGNIMTVNPRRGIWINGSQDLTISGNAISGESALSFEIEHSWNMAVLGNTVSGSSFFGIVTNHVSNSTISSNTVFDNFGCGFRILGSENNDISNNTSDGLRIEFSTNNIVSGNTFSGRYHGIHILDSTNNTVVRNAISNNNYSGIFIEVSSNNTISNNSIISNLEDGIALDGGRDNIVTHNAIKENGAYGMSCGEYEDDILIHSNMLAYNTVNAYDEGTNNHWNTTGRGNYWSDYNGTGVYPIPGTAGSIDHHPAVYESVPPAVSHPADVSYEEGTTGHILEWTASDDHPSAYAIYRNGTQVTTASWNGSLISISVDGLSAGVYNYTTVLSDIFGNQATDTVFVIVTAQTTTPEPPDGLLTTLVVVFLGIIGVEAVVAIIILLRYRRRVPPGTG